MRAKMKQNVMVSVLADNVISPLGETSEENYQAVKEGKSAIRAYARIATRLGIQLSPIVVCNACISGLAAMILASRLLVSKKYDYAVVCGADCPGRFIISGFQSLNAMSAFSCQPFDIERQGLNLGEAAATVVLGREITTKSVYNG